MSSPEVGEAYVEIRPVIGADFGQQISQQVDTGIQGAQAQADRMIDEVTKKIGDLQMRAQTATLRGDDVGASRLQAQAGLEQVIYAAAESRRQAQMAVGEDQAAMRDMLLASADAYDQARVKIQEAINRSQTTGRPVTPETDEEGGILNRLESLGRESGSRGGLGYLLRSGARFGAIGLAATAAFQAIGELTTSLRVSGDEAYTMEGKFRNAGASLLTGNFIGAFKALTAERKAYLDQDLTSKLQEEKAKIDPLAVSTEKLNAAYAKGPDEIKNYLQALQALGGVSTEEALALYRIAKANDELAGSAKAAADAIADQTTKIKLAGSEVAAYGEQVNAVGQRGVGGVLTDPTRPQSSTIGDLIRDPIYAAPQQPHDYGNTGPGLGNQVRDARAAAIRDESQRLAAQLRNAKIVQGQTKEAFDLTIKGTKEANDAWAAYRIAVAHTAEIQNSIATNAEQAAKAAKDAAGAKAKEHQAAVEAAQADVKAAHELSLENAIAEAALTKMKKDDEKAFAAAIAYWRGEAKDAENTALERQQARAKVDDLVKQRVAFRKGGQTDPEHTAADLQQLRIENRIAAAGLTNGLADDKKFTKQLIAFWKEQVANATGYDKEQARSRLIAAQLALKGLGKTTSGPSVEVITEELFKEAGDQFRRFGSNISSSANGLLAPQDARGLFASNLLSPADRALQSAQRTRDAQLAEAQKQTALLTAIAGPRVRASVPGPKRQGEQDAIVGGAILRGL